MSNKEDPLDNEISVEGSLTETGVKVKLSSRLMSAVDRLAGNIIDAVSIPIEASNSRKRALMNAERAIIEAKSKSIVQRIDADPEFADRAINSHLLNIMRKQENKEAVIEVAREELKRLPTPDPSALKDAPDTLDDDWLNFFEPLAEKATSERMRDLFGRILSGEIRKPGAFSFSTLRVASELDQQTAELFQRFASVRFRHILPRKSPLELPTHFGEFLELEVAGLVSFGNGTLISEYAASDKKLINLGGQKHLGLLRTKAPNKTVEIPAVILTRVGVQLASILPNDELQALRLMVASIKDDLEYAAAHVFLADSKHYDLTPVEVLVQETEPPATSEASS